MAATITYSYVLHAKTSLITRKGETKALPTLLVSHRKDYMQWLRQSHTTTARVKLAPRMGVT